MGRVHLVFSKIINDTSHLIFTVDMQQQSETSPEINMSVHFEGPALAMQYMKDAHAGTLNIYCS
jgi:hypothetical protein